MGFLLRLRQNRQVETQAGEACLRGERHPQATLQRQSVRLFGPEGSGVALSPAPGKREPGCLAFWSPWDGEPQRRRPRVWRDVRGLGWTGTGCGGQKA